jgi:predicted dehydrogenase
LVDRLNIQVVNAIIKLPSYVIPNGGIRFNYELSGGNMLDLGTYPMSALRQIMSAEPEEYIACKTRVAPPPRQLYDEFAEVSFLFPGGRIKEAVINMRALVMTFPTFNVIILHNEVKLNDLKILEG